MLLAIIYTYSWIIFLKVCNFIDWDWMIILSPLICFLITSAMLVGFIFFLYLRDNGWSIKETIKELRE
jgi:hypothetical protein